MERTDQSPAFEGWAILEIMGHRRLGGYVTEVTLASAGMLRVELHGKEGGPYATQFYPPSALFCLTPSTEDVARSVGEMGRPRPCAPLRLTQESYENDDRGEDWP